MDDEHTYTHIYRERNTLILVVKREFWATEKETLGKARLLENVAQR